MPWRPTDISFDLDTDATEDNVATVKIETPAGILEAMAEIEFEGQTMRLLRFSIQGLSPHQVGITNLRVVADVVMERLGIDGLEIKGTDRTTGANPGRAPRLLRFTRRHRYSADG